MGIIKKTGKGAFKIAKAPLSFLVPKSNINYAKWMFKQASSLSTPSCVCPNCNDGRISPHHYNELPDYAQLYVETDLKYEYSLDYAYWYCENCKYMQPLELSEDESVASTKERFVELLGLDFSALRSAYEPDMAVVNSHMNKAYAFYIFWVFLFAYFMYSTIMGYLLFAIILTIFLFLVLLMGFRWSYRAWQAYTGNVFSDEPGRVFYEWLKGNNPLLHPSRSRYDKSHNH